MANLGLAFILALACLSSVSAGRRIPNLSEIESELTTGLIRQFFGHFKGVHAQIPDDFILDDAVGGIQANLIPILPPLPDPLYLNDSQVVIPEENATIVFGYSSSWNSNVTGLSQLLDNFTLTPTPDHEFLFKYTIDMPTVKIMGMHDTVMTFMPLQAQINSTGDYSIEFTTAHVGVAIKVKILLENAVEVTSASLDIAFDELEIFTTETTIGGTPIPWPVFNRVIDEKFEEFWAASKPNIDILVAFALNFVLEDCRFTDIISGNIECIVGIPEEGEPTFYGRKH